MNEEMILGWIIIIAIIIGLLIVAILIYCIVSVTKSIRIMANAIEEKYKYHPKY